MYLNDLWTDMCPLLLVGVAHAFVHEWQSVCWKRSRKWAKFQTPHRMQRYGHFPRRPFFALLVTAPLSRTHQSHYGCSGCILVLFLSFHFYACLLALFFLLSSQFFCHFDVTLPTENTHCKPCAKALGNDHLKTSCKWTPTLSSRWNLVNTSAAALEEYGKGITPYILAHNFLWATLILYFRQTEVCHSVK